MVGDCNQLPPVEYGQPFKDLIKSKYVPVVELKQLYRCKDMTIICNCQKVIDGKDDFDDSGSFIRHTANTAGELEDTVVDKFVEIHEPDDPYATQIICPFNDKTCGVNSLNKKIQKRLNPDSETVSSKNRIFKIGDKVMFTKNRTDYSNGELGIITSRTPDRKGMVIRTGHKDIILPVEHYGDITLGYAITIHKSQVVT